MFSIFFGGLVVLFACHAPTPDSASTGDTAASPTGQDSGGGRADSGDSGGDAGGTTSTCEPDPTLVPTVALQQVSVAGTMGEEVGDAWFPLVRLSDLPDGFDGTARICRDLSDGNSVCTGALAVVGTELLLPSTILAPDSRFHVELSDGSTLRCSSTATASLTPLDFAAADLTFDEELPWSAPADLDVPPTLFGVAIHGGSDTGATTMNVVASVSTVEGLEQTALVHIDAGSSDAVQPLPDGSGWYLLGSSGILRLHLDASGATLEEWEMIPESHRCSKVRSLRRGPQPPGEQASPPVFGSCTQLLSHGMVVDGDGLAMVLSDTPILCPNDLSQFCMAHGISSLYGGEMETLWSYDDHVDEMDGRKLGGDMPYINGLGSDGDVTCATSFSIDFDTNQTLPAVICVGVSDSRTVFDLDATVTHLPHDVDPLTLPNGSHVLVIADNTNGDMDTDGNRKPPRIQLYDLPMDEASPDVQLNAIASYSTGIHVAENYRFGSVEPRLNADGQLVTVYVDGSGVVEMGVIDLDADSYTPLARTAIMASGGTLMDEADRGARRVGSYSLDTAANAE
ncbi:MAG: hypothetical protein GXP62_02205 [Oligoflexia bacterium]|nr:hypothetical protein [Oligoflexia bacterium]